MDKIRRCRIQRLPPASPVQRIVIIQSKLSTRRIVHIDNPVERIVFIYVRAIIQQIPVRVIGTINRCIAIRLPQRDLIDKIMLPFLNRQRAAFRRIRRLLPIPQTVQHIRLIEVGNCPRRSAR